MIRYWMQAVGLAGLLLAVTGLWSPSAPAQQRQSAIVEDISGTVRGIEQYEMLAPGRAIILPPGASIVLGYLGSCTREQITGGTVTVGTDGSSIAGGTVIREQLRCAPTTTPGPAIVFRGGQGGRKRADLPEAAVTLMYTAPAFVVEAPGDLSLERLDATETVLVFKANGRLLDFAKQQKSLAAGGLYRVELNGKATIFRVSLDAAEGGGPLLLRLVRF